MEHSRIYIPSHISKKAQSVNVFSFILMRDCTMGLKILHIKILDYIFPNYQSLELHIIEINFSIREFQMVNLLSYMIFQKIFLLICGKIRLIVPTAAHHMFSRKTNNEYQILNSHNFLNKLDCSEDKISNTKLKNKPRLNGIKLGLGRMFEKFWNSFFVKI